MDTTYQKDSFIVYGKTNLDNDYDALSIPLKEKFADKEYPKYW